jgi:hypothetical protein
LTLSIENDGGEDVTVLLGGNLANGRKYLVMGLTLLVQPAGEQKIAEYIFQPADYPGVIAGSLTEWVLALPAGTSSQMTVEASDFFPVQPPGSRLSELPGPGELWLRWVIQAPREADTLRRSMIGRTWTGVLESNRLTVP